MKFKKGSMTLGGYVQISDDENNPIWKKISSLSKEPEEETEVGRLLQYEMRRAFVNSPDDILYYFTVNILLKYLGADKTDDLLREVRIRK